MKVAKYVVLTASALFFIVGAWAVVYPLPGSRVFWNQRLAVYSIRSVSAASRRRVCVQPRRPREIFLCVFI